MKTTQFIDGKFIKTFTCNGSKPKQTLKEKITRAKRARTDARLVQILTK